MCSADGESSVKDDSYLLDDPLPDSHESLLLNEDSLSSMDIDMASIDKVHVHIFSLLHASDYGIGLLFL